MDQLMKDALDSVHKARDRALSEIPDNKPFHKIAIQLRFAVWEEEIRNPGFNERIIRNLKIVDALSPTTE